MSTGNSPAIDILVVDNPRSDLAPCWSSVKAKYSSKYHCGPPPSARSGHTTLIDRDKSIDGFKLGVASGRTYNIHDGTQLDTLYEDLVSKDFLSDVVAIVFVINCGAYDPMFEDSTSHPLNEDLALFLSLCQASWPKSTRMVLWIDGRATFRDEVESLDLEKLVSEYKGGIDMSRFVENVLERFEKIGQESGRELHQLFVEEGSDAAGKPSPLDQLVLTLEGFASERGK